MAERLSKSSHRRRNPLTDEWVLVSPQRTQRPWQGQQEKRADAARPGYDAACYLCPGNTRASGDANPYYTSTYVFDNDFPALLADAPLEAPSSDPFFQARQETGICRVICFSPRHDLSVPAMELADVARVVRTWQDEFRVLGDSPSIAYVQIFENKGETMGCSNPHPHCQVWATSDLPTIVATEQACQERYFAGHGTPLLLDYAAAEVERKERVVYENDRFVIVVPYWAVWPFETMILPKRPMPSIDRFDDADITAFADAYKSLTAAYDRVFDCEFPYSAGIHQAPTIEGTHEAWQLHMHFYPPLLRSATVKKFMVGYEMLAMPQRDLTPEAAADTLRRAFERR